jgi:hypothetical protein
LTSHCLKIHLTDSSKQNKEGKEKSQALITKDCKKPNCLKAVSTLKIRQQSVKQHRQKRIPGKTAHSIGDRISMNGKNGSQLLVMVSVITEVNWRGYCWFPKYRALAPCEIRE